MKATKDSRQAITVAASGDGLRALRMKGMSNGAVVEWNTDGSCTRPGPEAIHYEAARADCSTHSGLCRLLYTCPPPASLNAPN
jgi:hypothetical protein